MNANELRFKENDVLVITTMTKNTIIGNFMRGPQLDYDYWTLILPNDNTVIAIKGSNVESIVRPSEKALGDFLSSVENEENEEGV